VGRSVVLAGWDAYTFDGTVTARRIEPYHCSGRLAVNAFRPAATAAGSSSWIGLRGDSRPGTDHHRQQRDAAPTWWSMPHRLPA
jgi:hypothetical protein